MNNFTILGNEKVEAKNKDPTVNLALKTILENRQVLVFNNSKSRSEATAEKIADVISGNMMENRDELEKLSKKVLSSLSSPTKQCKRLAKVIQKGIAFHHSGLTPKQRALIETAFKEGLVKVISSTPTLAAGLNLPAYKVIINDYKRYSSRGYNDIPVLEFHQMAGRAGRPGKESEGRSVIMVKSDSEHERVVPKYIFGDAEEIISKLAVEPTLKMYMLSLISMDMANSTKEIKEFFSNTLYAHQYKDIDGLYLNLVRILNALKDYNFVIQEDDYYMATPLGKKVSELYLNPDTANYFITNIDKFFNIFAKENISKYDIYSLIHFIVNTMEMRPLFNLRKEDIESYSNKAAEIGDDLTIGFNPFEQDYDEFMKTLKTTDIFMNWIDEAPEDYISDRYNVTPGELHYKLEVVDWLLYCLEEISIMKKNFYFKNFLNKLRLRFRAGIREELISLISLKGVGRVRARKLFKAGLKKISDLKKAEFGTISRIVGDSTTIKIKEQLMEEDSDRDSKLEVNEKPKEIKIREVSNEEVDNLLDSINTYEKEKEEKNKNLNDYF